MRLRAAYTSLLAPRQLDRPDGRPLYRYRFDNAEYEGVRTLLRQCKSALQSDAYGFALFVMFVAEWYRRDRTGGHWDWIRPLREIGVSYEAHSPRSELHYQRLKYIVETGLELWKRPLIARGQFLYSVVGEAGFPVAALEEGRLGIWLRRCVLAIEKGALAEDAVAAEAAARISDRHAQVMFDAAVDLCQVAVKLRKALSEQVATTDEQLVDRLDRSVPDWRSRLPFDVGDKGFFALFRDLMAAKDDAAPPTKALRVTRTIRKSADRTWSAYANVALTGEVVRSSLAPSVAALLVDTDRARVIGRGAWAEFSHPMAVLERWRSEVSDRWDLRPLQREASHRLDLTQDVILGAATSGRAAVDFVPDGGQALLDPVIAFRCEADHPRDADELVSVGSSSGRVRAAWMVLAISDDADVRFDGETVEVGAIGTRYRLVGFSGRATLDRDGATTSWATGADSDRIVEIGVTGETVGISRGVVFRGLPTLWLSDDGHARRVLDRKVRWRPAGTRSWRAVTGALPVGTVDLAATEQDGVIATVRVAMMPKSFMVDFDRPRKTLIIEGHEAAVVSGTTDRPLRITRSGDAVHVDLSTHRRGEDVQLEFRWESSVTLRLVDPFCEPLLLAPSGRPHATSGPIAVGRLQGYRLMAPGGHKLLLEARNRTLPVVHTSLSIDGPTPLSSLESQLRELLGSAATIDARVRLVWEGQSRHFAEIGWYDMEDGLFAVLNGPSATLSAISLTAPAQVLVGAAQQEKWALQGILPKEIGPGPWLVFGRTTDGATIRPKVVPEPPGDTTNASPVQPSPLDNAIVLPTHWERRQHMTAWCDQPAAWSTADAKKVVAMCCAARRHGVPFNTFDVLDVIGNHPGALPHLLAVCSTMEERSSVLALQSEFPFLWHTTPIAAWMQAYEAETKRLEARLATLGEFDAREEAHRSMAKKVANLGELEPGVRPHAAAVLRALFPRHLDGVAAAKVSVGPHTLRSCGASFVARHGERHFEGEAGRLAKLVKRYPAYWSRFDDSFWDPIAAPIVAAQIAAGVIPHSSETARQLRSVWHIDRDHFETSFAIAMNNEATRRIDIGTDR